MVPIRIDIFSVIIFLGAIQGFFLALFFFLKRREAPLPNTLIGLQLFVVAALSADVFLGYSGYMTRVLHLVDFTEPLIFLFGPFVYLYTYVTVNQQTHLHRKQYLHFVPALLYAGYFLFFFLQSGDYKYNAYIDAYYPELPRIEAASPWHEDPLLIKKHLSLYQLIHYGTYIILSIRCYFNWPRRRTATNGDFLIAWMKALLLGLSISFAATVGIKLAFERDFGEYLIASQQALLIYVFSFFVISRSVFFKQHPNNESAKYEKSALTDDRAILAIDRLKALMKDEKPHLDPDFSLPVLAGKVHLSTHLLSQLLNAHLGQNFYEFTAAYRIQEAQQMLGMPKNKIKSIEQIAEEVGYYSKSSFNTAFKKITGITPSQYRREALKGLE